MQSKEQQRGSSGVCAPPRDPRGRAPPSDGGAWRGRRAAGGDDGQSSAEVVCLAAGSSRQPRAATARHCW